MKMAEAVWVVREVSDEPYRVERQERREVDGSSDAPDMTADLGGSNHAGLEDSPAGPADRGQDASAPSDALDIEDIDAIEALGEEYVTLDAHIDAATQRSLAILAEFDRLRGRGRFRSSRTATAATCSRLD
jgi:hypothetical protein